MAKKHLKEIKEVFDEHRNKVLEHYINIYKANPENLTLSGKHKLINLLINERENAKR